MGFIAKIVFLKYYLQINNCERDQWSTAGSLNLNIKFQSSNCICYGNIIHPVTNHCWLTWNGNVVNFNINPYRTEFFEDDNFVILYNLAYYCISGQGYGEGTRFTCVGLWNYKVVIKKGGYSLAKLLNTWVSNVHLIAKSNEGTACFVIWICGTFYVAFMNASHT